MNNDLLKYVQLYSYLVEFSTEDEAYIAKCLELGIMAHGDTQEEALKEIKEAVALQLEMLCEDGEDIIEPFSLKEYSGNLNLRMTPEKHKEIAQKAQNQCVSINDYINSKL